MRRSPDSPLNPGVIVLGLGAFVLLGTLVIAGTSNAVNISDGMDGLAAGRGGLRGRRLHDPRAHRGKSESKPSRCWCRMFPGTADLMVVAGAMTGACLGFLWFNSSPAMVFMGDTGSLALGGLLGYLAVAIRQEALLDPDRRHLLPRDWAAWCCRSGWFKCTTDPARARGDGSYAAVRSTTTSTSAAGASSRSSPASG